MVKNFVSIIAQLPSQKRNLKTLTVFVEQLNVQGASYNLHPTKNICKSWKNITTLLTEMWCYIWLLEMLKILELLKKITFSLINLAWENVWWLVYLNGSLNGLAMFVNTFNLKNTYIQVFFNQNFQIFQ